MSVKHKLVTADELWNMSDPPGKRLELVDGEVVDVSPVTMRHGVIVATLTRLLDDFVRLHDLGIVAAGDVGYVLRRGPDRVRAPDISFVAWGNVPESELPERGFWEGPPALAVEVVSADDRANEVHAKVHHFLEAGTQQFWVLWPRQRTLTVYARDTSPRELGPDADVEGGDILPGFTARVGDLFEIRRHR
jgi:Uma2 family endonuclease